MKVAALSIFFHLSLGLVAALSSVPLDEQQESDAPPPLLRVLKQTKAPQGRSAEGGQGRQDGPPQGGEADQGTQGGEGRQGRGGSTGTTGRAADAL